MREKSETTGDLTRPEIIVSTILVVWALFPYLSTGFMVDDEQLSTVHHVLSHHGVSGWSQGLSQVEQWTKSGRLYPLNSLISYPLWSFLFYKLSVYRIFEVFTVALNLAFWFGLLKKLGASSRFALFSTALTVMAFQLRKYTDPIAGFSDILPLLFLTGEAAAFFLLRFLRNEKRGILNFLGFTILSLCLPLYYELGLVFFPIFAFIAFQFSPSHEKRNRALASIASTLFTYLVAAAVVRTLYAPKYTGVAIGIHLRNLWTYLCQFSGAFPLTYPVFARSGMFMPSMLLEKPIVSLESLLFFAAAFWIFRRLLLGHEISPEASRIFKFTAAILWFAPPALLAITVKYNEEVGRLGEAYLPVYFSCFGSGLFLARSLSGRKLLTAFSLALIWTLGHATNQIAAAHTNIIWKYPRQILEDAIDSGVFSGLPENALVYHPRQEPWITEEYLSARLGSTVLPLNLAENLTTRFAGKSGIIPYHCQEKEPCWFLRFESFGDRQSILLFAEASEIDWDADHGRIQSIFSEKPVKIRANFEVFPTASGELNLPGLDLNSVPPENIKAKLIPKPR